MLGCFPIGSGGSQLVENYQMASVVFIRPIQPCFVLVVQ